MNHETRCAWVRQNDATGVATPFLCGAAAAQMILYGRHDARFVPGTPDLATAPDVQVADQAAIWQAIIAQSKTCKLPTGVSYIGTPEAEQIRERDDLSWATFPKALARTLAKGVALPSGDLAGVAATVRSLSSEQSMENAIIASLKRGVAAALLIDGRHWVVVSRYEVKPDGGVSIWYRNGLMPKVESNVPLALSTFESKLSAVQGGVFDDKYVAVTASSSVPLVAQPHAMMVRVGMARRPPRPPLPLASRLRVAFPDRLGEELPARISANRTWQLAFRAARPRTVLPVQLRSRRGPGFYSVNFESDRLGRSVRTGTAIVDAATLQPILVAGVENDHQELPRLLDANEARTLLVDRARQQRAAAEAAWIARAQASPPGTPPPDPLAGVDPASLTLDGDLTWSMCDQSTSPFLPFFVVTGKDAHTGAARRLYLRADGDWLGEITERMAGV